jgi:hypothetical protein
MVFKSTAIDPPAQPEIRDAAGTREVTRRNDVQRDAVDGRGLRGGRDARRHATLIDAPETGNSKAVKCGSKEGCQGKSSTADLVVEVIEATCEKQTKIRS